MSSRIVVAMAVLGLPLALGAVSAPAQARGEVVRCSGHEATIVGTRRGEVIHGTEGPDVIVGLFGRDAIYGGGGDDLICGGTGRDTLDGGAGNDSIHGNLGEDTLSGGDGDDHLFGNKGSTTIFNADQGDDAMASHTEDDFLDYANAPNGVSVDLATGMATGWGTDTFHIGSFRVTLFGSLHDDTLLGTSRGDIIAGAPPSRDGSTPSVQGNDTIDGRGGDDLLSVVGGSIVGGDGDDTLFGSGSATLDLDGGAGNDALESQNPGHVLGGPGDDQLSWDSLGHPLVAGLSLDGGEGTDWLRLWGGLTLDMDSGSMSLASVTATAANFENFQGDLGGSSPDTSYDITGTNGPNSISVSGNGSTIHALGGDDLIVGDGGDNLIDGGPGEDTADGREGTDTCASVEHPSNCEVIDP